jgi:hypothetical protein
MSFSKIRLPKTEGLDYLIVAQTSRGTVGFHKADDGDCYETRVYPSDNSQSAMMYHILSRKFGWHHPKDRAFGCAPYGYFWRRSGGEKSGFTRIVMSEALQAVISGGCVPKVNYKAPYWMRSLVSRAHLVGLLKLSKVRGWNLAHNWSMETLCKKATPEVPFAW